MFAKTTPPVTEIERLRESGLAMNGKSLLSSFIIKLRVFFLRRSPPASINCPTLLPTAARTAQVIETVIKRERNLSPLIKFQEKTGFETFSSHPTLPRLESLDGKTCLMKSCFPNAFVIRLSAGEKNLRLH